MRSGPIPAGLTRRTFLRAGATGAAWALLRPRARGEGAPRLEPRLEAVPGAVLHHSPASSRLYVGSPGLAVLDDGSYVASCDEFGPGSRGSPSTTYVYRSTDRGRSWARVSKVQPAGVGTLFVHAGSLYLMGTLGGIRPLVIRRSDDGGASWTDPTDGRSGLLREGRYSTAPVPVLEHDGRLWRAVELGHTARWPSGFRAAVMSAPADADLLHAGCWRQSEPLASRSDWLDGEFRGWLEGNVCAAPDGGLVNLLRADVHPGGGRAALTTVSPDGEHLRFDPEAGFVDFPGGSKKFTVRWDEPSEAYWSLTNWIPTLYAGANPNRTRNTLALVCSRDLRSWTVRAVALHHPDRWQHGFQYADWRVDGDDLVWVSRTAYDDGLGGAHDQHDANLLTFHRMSDFRHRSMEDAPAAIGERAVDTGAGVSLHGRGFELVSLHRHGRVLSNRRWLWRRVPPALRGWRITRSPGGVPVELVLRPHRAVTVRVARAAPPKSLDWPGWHPTGEELLHSGDRDRRLHVYAKRLRPGATEALPKDDWVGPFVLLPPRHVR